MKKLAFSFVAIIVAMLSMVTFTACSSDDDDNNLSEEEIKENITGTWQSTHINGYWYKGDGGKGGYQKVDMDIDDKSDDDANCRLVIGSSKIKEYFYRGDNRWFCDSEERYRIDGNKIRLINLYDNDVYDTWIITKMNKNTMKLEQVIDDDEMLKATITYKKLSNENIMSDNN